MTNLQNYVDGPGEWTFGFIERDGKYYLTDASVSGEQLEAMLAGTFDAEAMAESVDRRRYTPYDRPAPTPTPRSVGPQRPRNAYRV